MIALHFLRFAFTPLCVSMNPKNLSSSIPNRHFFGFNRKLYDLKAENTLGRSNNTKLGLGLYHHIIYVYLNALVE